MTKSSAAPDGETAPTVRRWAGSFWRWLIPIAIVSVAIAGTWSRNNGPEASYRRGRQALVEGERDVVLRESERLIHTVGYEPHGCLLKGLLLARIDKIEEAVGYLQKAAANKLLAVEANTTAARCFYESGRFLQAIDAALIALQQDASCLDARRWLAAAYYDLGAVSQATSELKRISVEAPTDPRPDRLLGLIAKDNEQYAEAVVHYRKSLVRDPRQPAFENVMAEFAESQIKLGQFDDALATLKECPRSAVVLTLEANCHIGLSQLQHAHDRLHDALMLEPRYFPAKLTLGKLLLDQGQSDDAIRVLAEAALIEPQNSQVHFQLSQALRGSGKTEEADAEARRMLEIQVLEREFSDLHTKAIGEPANAEIRRRTGEVAVLLGKPELAKVWFRAALALNPNDAKSRSALRRIQNSTGRH